MLPALLYALILVGVPQEAENTDESSFSELHYVDEIYYRLNRFKKREVKLKLPAELPGLVVVESFDKNIEMLTYRVWTNKKLASMKSAPPDEGYATGDFDISYTDELGSMRSFWLKNGFLMIYWKYFNEDANKPRFYIEYWKFIK